LRERFGLFCKFSPVHSCPALADAGALRHERLRDVDVVVVRENVGGVYFGGGERTSCDGDRDHVVHTFCYEADQIRRVVAVAARLAAARRGRLAVVVKRGGMPLISELWIEIFAELTSQSGLETTILDVDNACYQIVAAPGEFDVVVAPNLFGDVLADVAALLLPTRGMSYSGNFGPRGVAVYQTGHGAAWDVAALNVANPIGQIRSAAMMLRESFDLPEEAGAVERAIQQTLANGLRTRDVAMIGSTVVGTDEMGQYIAEAVKRELPSGDSPQSFVERLVPFARTGRSPIGSNNHSANCVQLQRRNPCNWDEVVASTPTASRGDVQVAGERAAEIQREWVSRDSQARAETLRRLARSLQQHENEIADQLVLEIGKPITAAKAEIQLAVSMIRATVELLVQSDHENIDETKHVQARRRPRGVVGVITPWNNPIAIPAARISAALVLGNGVLWKPAVEAPRTALLLTNRFEEAGVPSGLVNLLIGGTETAERIIDHPRVSAVALTGSISTGQRVLARCARRGVPLQAELGGNNAAVVMSDVDFKVHARALAMSAFSFAGQRCTAIQRFVVEQSIFDSFRKEIVAATQALIVGDPRDPKTDVGPLVSRGHRARVQSALEQAVREGGQVLCGGTEPPGMEQGCWLTPAVVADVAPDRAVAQEEIFGPVVLLLAADDFDHAVEIANGVQHGLVATLCSNDTEYRRKFVDTIDAGIVNLVPGPLNVHPSAPFGGWKASGYGPPEHGVWDRDIFTKVQALYGWNGEE
jgi:acyl-CoA reductase-like NAD-dependent aldehyde dehydrogenase/isocitrate/isopropylmalate dehydrogenase